MGELARRLRKKDPVGFKDWSDDELEVSFLAEHGNEDPAYPQLADTKNRIYAQNLAVKRADEGVRAAAALPPSIEKNFVEKTADALHPVLEPLQAPVTGLGMMADMLQTGGKNIRIAPEGEELGGVTGFLTGGAHLDRSLPAQAVDTLRRRVALSTTPYQNDPRKSAIENLLGAIGHGVGAATGVGLGGLGMGTGEIPGQEEHIRQSFEKTNKPLAVAEAVAEPVAEMGAAMVLDPAMAGLHALGAVRGAGQAAQAALRSGAAMTPEMAASAIATANRGRIAGMGAGALGAGFIPGMSAGAGEGVGSGLASLDQGRDVAAARQISQGVMDLGFASVAGKHLTETLRAPVRPRPQTGGRSISDPEPETNKPAGARGRERVEVGAPRPRQAGPVQNDGTVKRGPFTIDEQGRVTVAGMDIPAGEVAGGMLGASALGPLGVPGGAWFGRVLGSRLGKQVQRRAAQAATGENKPEGTRGTRDTAAETAYRTLNEAPLQESEINQLLSDFSKNIDESAPLIPAQRSTSGLVPGGEPVTGTPPVTERISGIPAAPNSPVARSTSMGQMSVPMPAERAATPATPAAPAAEPVDVLRLEKKTDLAKTLQQITTRNQGESLADFNARVESVAERILRAEEMRGQPGTPAPALSPEEQARRQAETRAAIEAARARMAPPAPPGPPRKEGGEAAPAPVPAPRPTPPKGPGTAMEKKFGEVVPAERERLRPKSAEERFAATRAEGPLTIEQMVQEALKAEAKAKEHAAALKGGTHPNNESGLKTAELEQTPEFKQVMSDFNAARLRDRNNNLITSEKTARAIAFKTADKAAVVAKRAAGPSLEDQLKASVAAAKGEKPAPPEPKPAPKPEAKSEAPAVRARTVVILSGDAKGKLGEVVAQRQAPVAEGAGRGRRPNEYKIRMPDGTESWYHARDLRNSTSAERKAAEEHALATGEEAPLSKGGPSPEDIARVEAERAEDQVDKLKAGKDGWKRAKEAPEKAPEASKAAPQAAPEAKKAPEPQKAAPKAPEGTEGLSPKKRIKALLDAGDYENAAKLAREQATNPGKADPKGRKVGYVLDDGKMVVDIDADGYAEVVSPSRPQRGGERTKKQYSIEPNELGYYSQAERTLSSGKTPEKLSGEQWLGWLKNPKQGIKAEELKWSGLEEHLKTNAGRNMSKGEVLKFLKDNEVEVVESTRKAGQAKFNREGLVLPRGENYREVVLRMKNRTTESVEVASFASMSAAEGAVRNGMGDSIRYNDMNRMYEVFKQQEKDVAPRGHFEEPNTLAHVRLTDRTGPNGERILFVEEIQSDWAQKGRKEGFKPSDPRTWRAESEGKNGAGQELWTVKDAKNVEIETGVVAKSAEDALNNVKWLQSRAGGVGVPEGPFITETTRWTDLVTKRLLRMAAEEGYDKVSWTTGKQQAERYNQAKKLESVKWDPRTKHLLGWERDAKDAAIDEIVAEADLAKRIGADAAKRLLASQPESAHRFITNVEVGGEGMKAYYDRIVPESFKRVGKQVGVSVGTTDLSFIDGDLSVGKNRRGDWFVYDANGDAITSAFKSRETAEKAMSHMGTEPVSSIDVSGAREGIQKQGFPQYSLESKFGDLGLKGPKSADRELLRMMTAGQKRVPNPEIEMFKGVKKLKPGQTGPGIVEFSEPDPRTVRPFAENQMPLADAKAEARLHVSKGERYGLDEEGRPTGKAITAKSVAEALPPQMRDFDITTESGDIVVRTYRGDVRIRPESNIELNFEAVEAGYGKEMAEKARRGEVGAAEEVTTVDGAALVRIVKLGKLGHGLVHVALDHFASPKVREMLRKKYAGMDENMMQEQVAKAFEDLDARLKANPDWQPTNAIGRVLKRAYDFFHSVYRAWRPNEESFLRDVRSGKVFKTPPVPFEDTGMVRPKVSYSIGQAGGPRGAGSALGRQLAEAQGMRQPTKVGKGAIYERSKFTAPRLAPKEAKTFVASQESSGRTTDPKEYGATPEIGKKRLEVTAKESVALPKYGLESYREGKEEYRKQAKAIGMSEAEIERGLRDADRAAAILEMKPNALPVATPGSALRGNPDFGLSLDLDTNCPRAEGFNAAVEAIQNSGGKVQILDRGEHLALAQLMRDRGLTPQCTYCYAGSKRANRGAYAERASREGFTLRKGTPDEKTYPPIDPRLFVDEAYRAEKLKDPKVAEHYAAFKSYIGGATASIVKPYTPYKRGDIQAGIDKVARLSKGAFTSEQFADKMRKTWGLRIDSNTDFKPWHSLDIMQAVMDLGEIKVPAHTYTKEADMVLAFGDTGVKFNISLFGRGKKGYEIDFDSREGVHPEFARWAHKYTKHAGGMLLASDSKAIISAMRPEYNDRVGQIIPFHHSGMTNAESQMLGWTNFDSKNQAHEIPLAKNELKAGREAGDRGHTIHRDRHRDDVETYLSLCEEEGMSPRFRGFIYELVGDEVRGKIQRGADGLPIRRWTGTSGLKNTSAVMKEAGVKGWDDPKAVQAYGKALEKGYMKLIADFARTDTPFEPPKPKFNIEHIERMLQEWQAEDKKAGETTADADLVKEFLRLQAEGKLPTLRPRTEAENAPLPFQKRVTESMEAREKQAKAAMPRYSLEDTGALSQMKEAAAEKLGVPHGPNAVKSPSGKVKWKFSEEEVASNAGRTAKSREKTEGRSTHAAGIVSDIKGKSVIDWGSGRGDDMRFYEQSGATKVRGYDPTHNPERPSGMADVVTNTFVGNVLPPDMRRRMWMDAMNYAKEKLYVAVRAEKNMGGTPIYDGVLMGPEPRDGGLGSRTFQKFYTQEELLRELKSIFPGHDVTIGSVKGSGVVSAVVSRKNSKELFKNRGVRSYLTGFSRGARTDKAPVKSIFDKER